MSASKRCPRLTRWTMKGNVCRNPALGRRIWTSACRSPILFIFECVCLGAAYRLPHPLVRFATRSHLDCVKQRGARRAISSALTRASNGRSDRQVSAAKDFSRKSRSVDPVFIGARAHPEPGASSCAHQSGPAFRPWRSGSLRKQTVPVTRGLSAAFAGALASRGVPHPKRTGASSRARFWRI